MCAAAASRSTSCSACGGGANPTLLTTMMAPPAGSVQYHIHGHAEESKRSRKGGVVPPREDPGQNPDSGGWGIGSHLLSASPGVKLAKFATSCPPRVPASADISPSSPRSSCSRTAVSIFPCLSCAAQQRSAVLQRSSVIHRWKTDPTDE
jgi:hypothetical protein